MHFVPLTGSQFFFVIATMKTKDVLKRAWQWLSTEGYTNMKRYGVMMNKSCFWVMIWKHEFFIMTPWHFLIFISFCWKLLLCSFQNRSCFHCSYNQKRGCGFKVGKLTFSPCTGMLSYQWLDFQPMVQNINGLALLVLKAGNALKVFSWHICAIRTT